jgi:serine/threonine protein phosphatase PrpC
LPKIRGKLKEKGTVTQIAVRGNKAIARVNGVLSVSRALGDLTLQPFVSAEPEIQSFKLCEEDETTLVLACDGLWDVLSDQEALDVAKEALNVKSAAVKLVEAGITKMSMDNISVVVASMPRRRGEEFSRKIREKFEEKDRKN